MGEHAACMERLEIRTKFYSDYLQGRSYLGDPAIDIWIILKRILKEFGVRVLLGLTWIRVGLIVGLLKTRKLIFVFHERQGISLPVIRESDIGSQLGAGLSAALCQLGGWERTRK